MQAKYYLLVEPTASVPAQQGQLAISAEGIVLTLIMLGGTLVSNAFCWMISRGVAATEKRLDLHASLLAEAKTAQHELEKKVASEYVKREDFVHGISVMDAHIEQLRDSMQAQSILLESISTKISERYK